MCRSGTAKSDDQVAFPVSRNGSSASAGRALIMMSEPTNSLPRPRRRALGTRSARPVRKHAVVTILREADRRPVPEVAQQHGVSAQTIYSWRKHFGTLEPADMKRLRQLEQENGRLKNQANASQADPPGLMGADRDLEIDVLKEITRKKW